MDEDEPLWTWFSTTAHPIFAARQFAAEYFGKEQSRQVERLNGTWASQGGYLGVFTLVEGDSEYELRCNRGGLWQVRRI